MDDECYGYQPIAAEINRWFIPVRVDADRRPDIVDRYDLGGLPTTALLDADGEILGGGTFVPRDRLLEALQVVRERRIGSSPGFAAPTTEPPPLTDDQLIDVVFNAFDRTHAGFGTAPKFPLVAPVRLALDLFRESSSPEIGEVAARTLDAMAWNGLWDEDGGGFCRFAAGSDWTEPQREKLLATNAALLDLYLEAGVTLGHQRWLGRAADTLEFVQGTLALAPGEGWRTAPESDGTRLSDANAAMVSAALHASRVFDDGAIRQLALDALEAVLLATYRPGRGVAHCEGGVRGLLTDHVALAAAHLDAYDVSGDVVYQMMAQELMQFVARTLRTTGGALADRALVEGQEAVGLLARPLTPFVLNCDAAEVFHRLGRATDDERWHEYAVQTLESVAPLAGLQGPLAAHFLNARRSLAR